MTELNVNSRQDMTFTSGSVTFNTTNMRNGHRFNIRVAGVNILINGVYYSSPLRLEFIRAGDDWQVNRIVDGFATIKLENMSSSAVTASKSNYSQLGVGLNVSAAGNYFILSVPYMALSTNDPASYRQLRLARVPENEVYSNTSQLISGCTTSTHGIHSSTDAPHNNVSQATIGFTQKHNATTEGIVVVGRLMNISGMPATAVIRIAEQHRYLTRFG